VATLRWIFSLGSGAAHSLPQEITQLREFGKPEKKGKSQVERKKTEEKSTKRRTRVMATREQADRARGKQGKGEGQPEQGTHRNETEETTRDRG
jgi:hypothetical protein